MSGKSKERLYNKGSIIMANSTSVALVCSTVYCISSWVHSNHYFSSEVESKECIQECFNKNRNILEEDCVNRTLMINSIKSNNNNEIIDQQRLLIALCSGDIALTQFVLEPLVKNKPKLATKLLKKPPFRFLLDVIKKVFHNCFQVSEIPFFMTSLNPDPKSMTNEEKVIFLVAFIDYVDSLINQMKNNDANASAASDSLNKLLAKRISPRRILAGVHPDHTNKLLQVFGIFVHCSHRTLFQEGRGGVDEGSDHKNKNPIPRQSPSMNGGVVSPCTPALVPSIISSSLSTTLPLQSASTKLSSLILPIPILSIGENDRSPPPPHTNDVQSMSKIGKKKVNGCRVLSSNKVSSEVSSVPVTTTESETVVTNPTSIVTVTNPIISPDCCSAMSKNEIFLLDALACFEQGMTDLENTDDDDDDEEEEEKAIRSENYKISSQKHHQSVSLTTVTLPSIGNGYVSKMRQLQVKNSDRFKKPHKAKQLKESSMKITNQWNQKKNTNSVDLMIEVDDGDRVDNDIGIDQMNEIPDVLWKMAGLNHVHLQRNSIIDNNHHVYRNHSIDLNMPSLHQSVKDDEEGEKIKLTLYDRMSKRNNEKDIVTNNDEEDEETKYKLIDESSRQNETMYSNLISSNNQEAEISPLLENTRNRLKTNHQVSHIKPNSSENEDQEWEEFEQSWLKLRKWLSKQKEQRKKLNQIYQFGSSASNERIKRRMKKAHISGVGEGGSVNDEGDVPEVKFSERLQSFIGQLSDSKSSSMAAINEPYSSTLVYDDIPWPHRHESVLCIDPKDTLLERKKKLRIALIFWHPDHFKSLLYQIKNNQHNISHIKKENDEEDQNQIVEHLMERAHDVTRRIIQEKNTLKL